MEFFTVWWFDLVLVLALVAQVGACVSDYLGLGSIPRGVCAALTVLLELGLVISLLFIGGTLTDLLIVLMICTLVSAGATMLEGYMGKKRGAGSPAADGAEEGGQ